LLKVALLAAFNQLEMTYNWGPVAVSLLVSCSYIGVSSTDHYIIFFINSNENLFILIEQGGFIVFLCSFSIDIL